MNLSARLLAFAVLALLPLFGVLLLFQQTIGEARMAEVRAMALRQSQQASSEMTRVTDGIRAILTAVSIAPGIGDGDARACDLYLERLSRGVPHLGGIAILDPGGGVRCRFERSVPSTDYATPALVRDTLATGGFETGLFVRSARAPQTAVLAFAQPIRDDAGTVVGVAAAALDLSALQAIVASWPLPPNGSLTLADREGTIVARSPLPQQFVGTRIPEPFRRWVQAAEPGVDVVRSQDGTERILAYVPVEAAPSGIYVSSGIARDQAFALMRHRWQWSGWALVAGLLGSMIASAVAAHFLIRRPVGQLITLARDWAAGKPPGDRRTLSPDEFEKVAEALDEMGESIERRSATLISELNHRVKNTLVLVQAIGAQTAAQTRDPGAFVEKFGERLRSLGRTHDLLTAGLWRTVDLRELILAELAVTPASERVTLDGPPVAVPPNLAVSFSLILHELMTNAVKHGALGRKGGTLRVAWRLEGEGHRPADPRRTGDAALAFTWTEECREPVEPPTDRGFGSKLIARSIASIGKGDVRFRPEGLEVVMTVPLAGEPESRPT